ncbi:MAG: hypothetical protein HZC36_02945 [Armatimonadetes bacterium]|nr:hypothetical protein [Armatimonadota bacterium]
MARVAPLVLLLLALALAGCSSNPVAGTWKLQVPEALATAAKTMGKGESLDANIVFGDDGKFKLSGFGAGKSGQMEGSYSVNGKKVTLNFEKLDGTAITEQQMKPETAELSEDGKSFLIRGATFVKQ